MALVGPSGAGKSTVASLLLRFVDPSAGRVSVGGVDLAGCDVAGWRERVAWVPQGPTLFHGTVAANIALGAPGATDDAVRDAAERAGADAFIRALPDGYATLVGEAGRAAVRRPAPADRSRPCVPPGRGAGHPRRADGQPRRRERAIW